MSACNDLSSLRISGILNIAFNKNRKITKSMMPTTIQISQISSAIIVSFVYIVSKRFVFVNSTPMSSRLIFQKMSAHVCICSFLLRQRLGVK